MADEVERGPTGLDVATNFTHALAVAIVMLPVAGLMITHGPPPPLDRGWPWSIVGGAFFTTFVVLLGIAACRKRRTEVSWPSLVLCAARA